MSRRKSDIFFLFLAANICVLIFLVIHAGLAGRAAEPFLRERAKMVADYKLTDLCLFTDARYTRNPAVADLSTPFQDHPMSIEHFPSGSIIAPPRHFVRYDPGKQ